MLASACKKYLCKNTQPNKKNHKPKPQLTQQNKQQKYKQNTNWKKNNQSENNNKVSNRFPPPNEV